MCLGGRGLYHITLFHGLILPDMMTKLVEICIFGFGFLLYQKLKENTPWAGLGGFGGDCKIYDLILYYI